MHQFVVLVSIIVIIKAHGITRTIASPITLNSEHVKLDRNNVPYIDNVITRYSFPVLQNSMPDGQKFADAIYIEESDENLYPHDDRKGFDVYGLSLKREPYEENKIYKDKERMTSSYVYAIDVDNSKEIPKTFELYGLPKTQETKRKVVKNVTKFPPLVRNIHLNSAKETQPIETKQLFTIPKILYSTNVVTKYSSPLEATFAIQRPNIQTIISPENFEAHKLPEILKNERISSKEDTKTHDIATKTLFPIIFKKFLNKYSSPVEEIKPYETVIVPKQFKVYGPLEIQYGEGIQNFEELQPEQEIKKEKENTKNIAPANAKLQKNEKDLVDDDVKPTFIPKYVIPIGKTNLKDVPRDTEGSEIKDIFELDEKSGNPQEKAPKEIKTQKPTATSYIIKVEHPKTKIFDDLFIPDIVVPKFKILRENIIKNTSPLEMNIVNKLERTSKLEKSPISGRLPILGIKNNFPIEEEGENLSGDFPAEEIPCCAKSSSKPTFEHKQREEIQQAVVKQYKIPVPFHNKKGHPVYGYGTEKLYDDGTYKIA